MRKNIAVEAQKISEIDMCLTRSSTTLNERIVTLKRLHLEESQAQSSLEVSVFLSIISLKIFLRLQELACLQLPADSF